ncbi:hypothetical protein FPV67DRAFT_820743 [Lyophyllum atratum]|nr:hypothetical protein FPV67DRAFT_820743 [Lyophyllum atratum]
MGTTTGDSSAGLCLALVYAVYSSINGYFSCPTLQSHVRDVVIRAPPIIYFGAVDPRRCCTSCTSHERSAFFYFNAVFLSRPPPAPPLPPGAYPRPAPHPAPRLILYDHLSSQTLTTLERLLLHSPSHEPVAKVRRNTVDTVCDLANTKTPIRLPDCSPRCRSPSPVPFRVDVRKQDQGLTWVEAAGAIVVGSSDGIRHRPRRDGNQTIDPSPSCVPPVSSSRSPCLSSRRRFRRDDPRMPQGRLWMV